MFERVDLALLLVDDFHQHVEPLLERLVGERLGVRALHEYEAEDRGRYGGKRGAWLIC